MEKITLLIMGTTILSKLFGFGRELILAYFYGTSNISDAYLISTIIPGVIFGFISAGISTGYIPMYSKIEQDNGEMEANRFTNNLFNLLLIICSIIIMISFLFAEQIVRVFALGFEGNTLLLTIKFTKISLFAIYFIGFVSIFSGYLQLKGNYVIPALIGLPLNFIVVISIALSQMTNIMVLSIGFVVATSVQMFLMIPFIRNKGYRYELTLNIKDKHLINMVCIALPVIIGVSLNQINVLIDRTLASQIMIGGVSALNYANKLNGFVQGIFVMSIATVLFPKISRMAADNDINGLKDSLAKSITGINLSVMPATVGIMVLATPIVSILFKRGAFDFQAVLITSNTLFFYSIGMVAMGLREILSRVYYSMGDMKTPMINAVIGILLNIILNLILSIFLGIGGLALATSIAAIFTTGLMFISLQKKIGSFGMKQISISFVKILFASLIMGLLAKLSFNYLSANMFSQNLSLIIAIGIGILTYFIIIYFMKIDDVDVIVSAVKKKLKRN